MALKTTTTSKGSTVANASTMTSSQIKTMQKALQKAGYNVGSTGADGIWGANTAAALAQWKKDTGNSNTAGNSIGVSNYNKLVNNTSSGSSSSSKSGSSSSSSKSGSSSSSSKSGSSSKTTTSSSSAKPATFTETSSTNNAQKLVNNYQQLADSFNASVQEKINSAKAKGLTVQSGYDANGVLHYTTKGNDKLNAILDYYNSSDNPTYSVSGTTYYVGQTPTTQKTVMSANGNRPASVTYYANGNVDVKYDTGVAAEVGDYIQESDGTYTYYVDNGDGTSYWATGTPQQYADYVTEYKSNLQWELYQQELEAMQQQLWEATQNANQAAVDQSVEEIKAELENGTGQYNQDAEEAYLQMLKAQQTQQLQNAYQGDLGGIGTKQYSDVTANYDQQMLQIALEKENFVNQCNQQINQLKAQGRLQEAQLLSEWAQAKIDRYDEDYKWYEELKLSQAAQNLSEKEYELSKDELALSEKQLNAEISNADREYYYNRAVDMLERGALTENALEILGVDSNWAKSYADQINDTASISLSYAKAQLDALLTETAAAKKAMSSSSSSTSSSSSSTSSSPVSSGGSESQTVTVYHEDGTKSEITLGDDGSIPNNAIKNGDYIETTDGSKMWYNGSTGEFQGTKPKDTASNSDFLSAYQSLTGDTSTKSASSAYAKLQKLYDDVVAKYKAVNTRIVNGDYSSYAGGKNKVSGQTKADLEVLAKQYDRQAGTYRTLMNKYSG